jgi:hypothetical protein
VLLCSALLEALRQYLTHTFKIVRVCKQWELIGCLADSAPWSAVLFLPQGACVVLCSHFDGCWSHKKLPYLHLTFNAHDPG